MANATIPWRRPVEHGAGSDTTGLLRRTKSKRNRRFANKLRNSTFPHRIRINRDNGAWRRERRAMPVLAERAGSGVVRKQNQSTPHLGNQMTPSRSAAQDSVQRASRLAPRVVDLQKVAITASFRREAKGRQISDALRAISSMGLKPGKVHDLLLDVGKSQSPNSGDALTLEFTFRGEQTEWNETHGILAKEVVTQTVWSETCRILSEEVGAGRIKIVSDANGGSSLETVASAGNQLQEVVKDLKGRHLSNHGIRDLLLEVKTLSKDSDRILDASRLIRRYEYLGRLDLGERGEAIGIIAEEVVAGTIKMEAGFGGGPAQNSAKRHEDQLRDTYIKELEGIELPVYFTVELLRRIMSDSDNSHRRSQAERLIPKVRETLIVGPEEKGEVIGLVAEERAARGVDYRDYYDVQ